MALAPVTTLEVQLSRVGASGKREGGRTHPSDYLKLLQYLHPVKKSGQAQTTVVPGSPYTKVTSLLQPSPSQKGTSVHKERTPDPHLEVGFPKPGICFSFGCHFIILTFK